MTKEEAKYLSEILKAYSEGKTIQWSWKNCNSWNTIIGPWDFINDIDKIKYRIKPEPKLRPYANAEEFLKAMKEHGPYMTYIRGNCYYLPIFVGGSTIVVDANQPDYKDTMESYKWQDGTPCGIFEE